MRLGLVPEPLHNYNPQNGDVCRARVKVLGLFLGKEFDEQRLRPSKEGFGICQFSLEARPISEESVGQGQSPIMGE